MEKVVITSHKNNVIQFLLDAVARCGIWAPGAFTPAEGGVEGRGDCLPEAFRSHLPGTDICSQMRIGPIFLAVQFLFGAFP